MANIILPRGWEIPARAATPEARHLQRREIIARLGLGTAGLLAASALPAGCFTSHTPATGGGEGAGAGGPTTPGGWEKRHADLYPAKRNDRYKVPERGITPAIKATRYNNFYEFTVAKDRVWQKVDGFRVEPWTVEVAGLVKKPGKRDLDKVVRAMTLEERVYRHRCVEAWSMTVPWTGFPLARLLKWLEPLSGARYVRFVTALQRGAMPGLDPGYPWPYHEGLRMDEAMNELAFIATGLYGKPLPRQNGAPIRLVVPWKYGYKSIKSIVRIELTATRPKTFWNTLVPNEYDFISNVDPSKPHPRWSQATERLIDDGRRIPTQKYNGYGAFVAKLYG